MFFLKKIKYSYNIVRFFSNKTVHLNIMVNNIYTYDLNSRILFYLFFVMLMEKKYFQLYYFYNFFFHSNSILYLNKDLLNYLLLKLQNELEISLFIIKNGFLFNSSNYILKRKIFFNRKNLSGINYKQLFFNNLNHNMLKLCTNNIELYKNLEIFKKNEILFYVDYYIKILFFIRPGYLKYNSNFTMSYSNYGKRRVETINYNTFRLLFLKFFNLLINNIFFNAIPFFIFPKYLEEENFILYSYLLFIRSSVLYNVKYTRWLVTLRNLDNFSISFGTPCFFFILDVIDSFLVINPVKNLNLPVGALITKNMNANFFDYPIFTFSQSKGNIYIYFFFIIRLFFYGLQKRKKFFWGFFIKNKIIYELKRRLIDI